MQKPENEGVGLEIASAKSPEKSILKSTASYVWRSILKSRVLRARYFPNRTFCYAVAHPMFGKVYWSLGVSWSRARDGLLGKEKLFRFGRIVGYLGQLLLRFLHLLLPYSGDLRVKDLLVSENMSWRVEHSNQLFVEDEVRHIRSIPLSLRRLPDRLMWRYYKKGLFSVKNAYKVARTSCVSRALMASSSSNDGGAYRSLWQAKWKVRVSPRLKYVAGGFVLTLSHREPT